MIDDEADPFATPATKARMFAGLRNLLKACAIGTSRHDQARVLLQACMTNSRMTGKQLVGILATLGFNKQHVGKILFDFCGDDDRHYDWWRDDAGHYHLH